MLHASQITFDLLIFVLPVITSLPEHRDNFSDRRLIFDFNSAHCLVLEIPIEKPLYEEQNSFTSRY
jgi:hypothetical protein